MQLKKLMIEVMVFFVLGCFLCACGKTKDQTRKTTKDANKEIMIGGDNYPPFNYTDENGNLAGIDVEFAFVSLFAMEKRMLAKDAMVLHCSVLKVKSGVILFSGPSGIGKSTQAGLWTKYRKARVINGDRTLLKKENGRWMSLGWPICGSSEICYNEAYPVKAVIFLGQAEENDGRRLRYFDAIKAMISQITVNGWNPQFVEKIWNLTEDFAAQIPVFEYGCNMEEAAVDTLENLLLDILE